MCYFVTFKVDARFVAAVEAENPEKAIAEAKLRFYDADCGEFEDIQGEETTVEDENGNYVWERRGPTRNKST